MLNRILIAAFLLFATTKKAESKPEFRPSPTKKNQNAFLGGQLSNIENKNDFVNAPSNLQKFNPSATITENIQCPTCPDITFSCPNSPFSSTAAAGFLYAFPVYAFLTMVISAIYYRCYTLKRKNYRSNTEKRVAEMVDQKHEWALEVQSKLLKNIIKNNSDGN